MDITHMKKQYWWSYGVTSFVFRISLKSSRCIENKYAFISCIRIEKNIAFLFDQVFVVLSMY